MWLVNCHKTEKKNGESKMYRILIVDDERIERRGIRFLLRKIGVEMEVMEASNGKEALECLQKQEVDILFTDVKMPFMDGLELIQNVVPNHPHMKTVIFSGYSEFEYVKHALTMGVKNYILKPVDPKEFEKTVSQIMRELEQEQLQKQLKEKESNFMKEHILYSLVNGTPVDSILKKVEGLTEFRFLSEFGLLFLIEFSEDFFGKMGIDFPKMLKKQIQWEFTYLNLNPQQCLLLADKEASLGSGRKAGEELYTFIKKTFDVKPYIAVSKPLGSISHLAKEFENLELLMENKFYQSEQHVFVEAEEGNNNLLAQINDDILLKQIRQDLRMKDIESLKEHFERLCEKYRNRQDFSQVYIKFIFSSLLKDFYKSLPKERENEFNKDIDRLYRADQFSTVMEIINGTIHYLEEEFLRSPSNLHKEVEMIKEYIANHYGEEIGVDQLADMVHMAPSYLSHLFKKETGQNLSKYIKSYRMEQAKEKLEKTKEKIVTISCEVGYPNVSYFCQSFREYFGVSPQKYRDIGGDEG